MNEISYQNLINCETNKVYCNQCKYYLNKRTMLPPFPPSVFSSQEQYSRYLCNYFEVCRAPQNLYTKDTSQKVERYIKNTTQELNGDNLCRLYKPNTVTRIKEFLHGVVSRFLSLNK